MKKLFALILSLAMILSLVACSGSADSGAASDGGGGKQTVTIATGGTSGTYYAVANALGSVLRDKLTRSDLSIQASGASKANVVRVADGEADMATLQGDVLAYAHDGIDLFANDGAETSALWVTALYNETVQLIASPEITSIEQLRGKSVCVGDVGSGTEFNAKQILEAYDMTFDDINAVNGSFSDGVESLKDKKVAAAFTVAGAPTTAIVDLSTTNDFNMLSLSDDAVAYLTEKYPFLTYDSLPVGTYAGIDEEIKCVAVKAVLVASENLSEDVVYELVKAMYENQEALVGGHSKFQYLTLENALSGQGDTPLHPGAEKYYREVGLID